MYLDFRDSADRGGNSIQLAIVAGIQGMAIGGRRYK